LYDVRLGTDDILKLFRMYLDLIYNANLVIYDRCEVKWSDRKFKWG